MDYLKDLENRRRRELSMALQRLGLDRAVVDQHTGEISGNPRISEWVKSMQDKERKVEALYTQVYIGLRRWVCPQARTTENITSVLTTPFTDTDQ